MNQQRCKTCQHWQLADRDNSYSEITAPLDPDTFEPMALEFEVRYCKSDLLWFYERPIVPNGACVVDGSQYHAELLTASDFGCVNWKEKE